MADIENYIAGDSLRLDYVIVKQNDQPLSLVGATLKWAIASVNAVDGIGPASNVKTVGSGITLTNPGLGEVSVQINAGELNTPGIYIHELEIILPDGQSTTEQGRIDVRPAIYPLT